MGKGYAIRGHRELSRYVSLIEANEISALLIFAQEQRSVVRGSGAGQTIIGIGDSGRESCTPPFSAPNNSRNGEKLNICIIFRLRILLKSR